ncbi:MAG: class I adenylate cyclase [Gammaproteobacteria bacterium]
MSTVRENGREAGGAASVKRFLALNRDRLRRVRESLTPRQRDFLDALPLLFHINHPLLPGYVAKDTPYGIIDYAPSATSVRAARRLCRSFQYDRRTAPRFAIRALYMMGSPGTIAYSRHSDLDMWLLHDAALDGEALAALERKAAGVEHFAASLGLEVHFFVFDAARFRRGETLSLSDESSGSSQHCLLLDEFYRASVLVAGLPPLWWRVPAAHDHEYDAYVEAERVRRLLDPDDFIDFGALPTVPAEEFFGAAVWHLYKSIHSPYKSVLKLLLMESYAAEYPDITLLSTRYKQKVESSGVDLNAIDPYILMYTKVEEYLMARNDPARLEVLRRSFYLKANLSLSRASRRQSDDWRLELMQRMVAAWDWSAEQVERLDARDDWGLDIAVEERRDLTATLQDSYAMLSAFARQHANESKISERDLSVLGRKLYAAFEKRPSKVEVITRGICRNPVESALSLHEVRVGGDKLIWLLFNGTVSPPEVNLREPLKRSDSVAELVVWCHLNGLSNAATTWHVFAQVSRVGANEVRRLIEIIDRGVGTAGSGRAADETSGQRHIARVLLVVNIGVNPFAKMLSGGQILTSDHNDPLNYGGRGINLVHTLDLIFATTWDETFAFRYEGPRAVPEALAECLGWLTHDRRTPPLPTVTTECLGDGFATRIADRVHTLFEGTLKRLARGCRAGTPHLVMQSGEELLHLRVAQNEVRLDAYDNQAMLLRALGSAEDDSRHDVRFDPSCTRAGLLPRVLPRNRHGVIQVFAHPRGPRADVYMLDERGVLLVHRQECRDMGALLTHYRRFLEAALPRADSAGENPLGIETVEITDERGGVGFRVHESGPAAETAYLPLRVLADADSRGHQQFTIYTGDREFSTWEHGGSLFVQVAEYVLAQRATGETYPIYITDLDLSTRFRQAAGVRALRPFDLLSYKKRIEHQLTRALHTGSSVRPAAVDIAS